MDDNINIGHPFYFPTQAILVDDDPDFLEGVSLMLDNQLSYQLFQSAHQALDYVNSAHQQVNFLERCYSNYKTGPMVSDSLSHIDIGKLHHEVSNSARFLTASTVIVDYSMPEMNGLELLSSLKNPFIRKVLLTGQGDMELAVKAFNHQLIDQFIDKHDPKLKQKLNATIKAFQDQYFRNSFKLITDPILANNHDAFLVDASFQQFFNELREKLDIAEYYMVDSPHAGFLLVTADGIQKYLLIYTQEDLDKHLALLRHLEAPQALLDAVQAGEVLPDFDDQQEDLDIATRILPQWQDHYFPSYRISSKVNYFATLLEGEACSGIPDQDIIPYTAFLESNYNLNEILH